MSAVIDSGVHETVVHAKVRQRPRIIAAALAVLFAYFTFAWFEFDAPKLIKSAKPERAVLLARDAVAYKVHITKLLRRDRMTVAVEGERTSEYQTAPSWVTLDDKDATIDLGDGVIATIVGKTVRLTVPDYGDIRAEATTSGVAVTYPDGRAPPDWVSGNELKFDAKLGLTKRVQVSRAKIEVHRFFLGWENFFFPFNSPLHGTSPAQLWDFVAAAPRKDPSKSNLSYALGEFWHNAEWQHREVFIALLETLLMAVLGTLTAAIVALPLAFLAAANFTPSLILRFGLRRVFDFVRGIDMLIWSLIFIRSFGLGPLTGALAIAFTDTGTLGKLFSEALENIDKKQVDGVESTGAAPIARYRYGVIPQMMPVFASQVLYYLESNTRSATVIGALGAGGIGLLLVETIRTSRDWENTLYIIILTVIVVMLMDVLSNRLRQRLIHGKAHKNDSP